MEEIVIKDEKLGKGYKGIILSFDSKEDYPFTIQCGLSSPIDMTKPEARQLADAIYKLLGISIDDIKRQAFEAGRDRWNKMGYYEYTYPKFEDYNKRGI